MDKSLLKNAERITQSKREIDRLLQEIEIWLAKRKKADEELQQYHTQLETLGTMLKQASVLLRQQVDALPVDLSSGLLYSACRTQDLRAIWLRAVWNYYRTRFDQRDDPELGRMLTAADEVVWSCYAEAFKNAASARPEIQRGSAPLPYVESRFSPEAIPRDDPPPDLESQIDASFLGDFLKKLPIPLVILPPYCVDAPWWLIYLAHEVGHHVQFDLFPDRGAVTCFRELIVKALSPDPSRPLDVKTTTRWGNWAQEIFADAFSIAAVGGWATWAMAELETQGETAMVTPKVRYPAPVVRLALMARMAAELGETNPAQAGGFRAQSLTAGVPILKDGQDLRQIAAANSSWRLEWPRSSRTARWKAPDRSPDWRVGRQPTQTP